MKQTRPLIALTAAVLTVAVPATASAADDTPDLFATPDKVWSLVDLNGTVLPVPVNIQFPEADTIAGQAPCNRFFGGVTIDGGLFNTGVLASTQMACDYLAEESEFLRTLETMTRIEIDEETLTLENPETGERMVFTTTAPER